MSPLYFMYRLKIGISDDDKVHIAAVTVPAMCSCLGMFVSSDVMETVLFSVNPCTQLVKFN